MTGTYTSTARVHCAVPEKRTTHPPPHTNPTRGPARGKHQRNPRPTSGNRHPGGPTGRPHLHRVTAAIAAGKRPDPFRTRKLSPSAPMVLPGGPGGRVGRRRTPITVMAATHTQGGRHHGICTNPTGTDRAGGRRRARRPTVGGLSVGAIASRRARPSRPYRARQYGRHATATTRLDEGRRAGVGMTPGRPPARPPGGVAAEGGVDGAG